MADDMDALVGAAVATELKKIEESVKDTHAKLAEAVTRQEKEIKEMGGTSTFTKAALEKLENRYDQEVADLKGNLGDLLGKIEELKVAQAELEEKRDAEIAKRMSNGRKNVLEVFENDKEWKNWSPEASQNSPKIHLGRIDQYNIRGGRKNITGAASLNAVLGITNWADIYGEPVIEDRHLRSYMTVETASGASVAYVRRTEFDNGAAFQVEGDEKADSSHTFTDEEARACVLAHTSTISKQQARSTPTVVNYIQNDLLNGLLHTESRKLLFSDGAPGSFKGIANTDGIQSYVRGVQDDTPIDALRRSETQLQAIYLNGDLYVCNHEDWEAVELQKDSENRYLWVSVQDGGTARMWRKPVFVTPAMAKGTFINGAFRTCATLLDFERATVQIFPQHADYAKRNLLLILAEEVIGLAVTVPAGFVVGQYTAVGSGS